jgi:hypothetical protein
MLELLVLLDLVAVVLAEKLQWEVLEKMAKAEVVAVAVGNLVYKILMVVKAVMV